MKLDSLAVQWLALLAAFAVQGNALTLKSKSDDSRSVLSNSFKQQWPSDCGRRTFGSIFTSNLLSLGLAATVAPTPAMAYAQEKEDKDKIARGYKRLSFLLDNWVAETTVCGKSDNPYTTSKGCERTPIKVMDFLGFKSTDDPLFKADKTLKRLAVLVPDSNGPEYLDALEKWTQAAEEASGMAYVSSWGEANPGGGKDRVELFIERAKKNVVDARDGLGTAMDLLGLEK